MNQVLAEGINSICQIDQILAKYQYRKILLVTGKSSYQACGAKDKIESLLSSKEVVFFSDFVTNPMDSDVIKGVNIFNQENCDLIIAIGGGSVLDMAKLIKFYSSEKSLFGIDLIAHGNKPNTIPLIAIPTTAGSGSESTHFAVVYIDGIKHSIADQSVLPDAVILEPSFLLDTPVHITRCSGIDALCQSIESIWNVYSTAESEKFASEALALMLKNLPIHIKQSNLDSATAIQKGAYLAGKAINITKTTAPHAMSYALTSKFGICHGQAVAVYLPAVLLINSQVNNSTVADNSSVEQVEATMSSIYKAFDVNNADQCIYEIHGFMKEVGLKTSLGELGVKAQHREELLSTVNIERLANNPRKLNQADLIEIFDQTL